VKHLKGILYFLSILLVWFIISRNSNPLFVPKPEAVAKDFIEYAQNGMLWRSIIASFFRITASIVIASAISIPIALLVTHYKWLDGIISPLTDKIRYIPVTVFYPLAIMWFGIEETMKIAFLSTASFLFLFPSIVLIVKETPRDLVETALTMNMKPHQAILNIVFPYSLPTIMQNFLLAYGVGWTYVIIVEVVNSLHGLGHLINIGSQRGRTDIVYMAVLVIVLISVIIDNFGKKLIRWLYPWKFARQLD
jgi:NitT/TauT family transport system permease protein